MISLWSAIRFQRLSSDIKVAQMINTSLTCDLKTFKIFKMFWDCLWVILLGMNAINIDENNVSKRSIHHHRPNVDFFDKSKTRLIKSLNSSFWKTKKMKYDHRQLANSIASLYDLNVQHSIKVVVVIGLRRAINKKMFTNNNIQYIVSLSINNVPVNTFFTPKISFL